MSNTTTNDNAARETGHTPGPWDTRKGSYGIEIHASGYCIAEIVSAFHESVDEANAKLIAAAPDLLAALIFLGNDTNHAMTEMARARMNEAIAKATGKLS